MIGFVKSSDFIADILGWRLLLWSKGYLASSDFFPKYKVLGKRRYNGYLDYHKLKNSIPSIIWDYEIYENTQVLVFNSEPQRV